MREELNLKKTFNKTYSGQKQKCVKMPNAPYTKHYATYPPKKSNKKNDGNMINPWLTISHSDYESHMLETGQAQVLNEIKALDEESVTILETIKELI